MEEIARWIDDRVAKDAEPHTAGGFPNGGEHKAHTQDHNAKHQEVLVILAGALNEE